MKINYKKSLKVVKEVIFYVFIFLMIFTSIINFISRDDKKRPTFFGYSTLIVVSDSMEPTLRVKEFLILKNIDFNDVEKEDIVSFYYDIKGNGVEELVTHRVVNIIYDGEEIERLETKGDKNQWALKEEVYEHMFEGKIVFNSYFIGAFIYFLISTNILFISIAGFFLFLIVKQVISVIKMIPQIKNKKGQI